MAVYYTENEIGAKLIRPELSRLLYDSHPGDVLVLKQMDRLSRLTSADLELLGAELSLRQVRVVTLDVLAAAARKDCEDRRRRQPNGRGPAKAAGGCN